MSRALPRAVTAGLTGLLTVLLTAGPALASGNPLGPSEGADPGRGLGTAASLLLFLGLPLLLLLAVGGAVLLPGLVRANRYRPAKGWSAAPVWFAGPSDPVTAVQDAVVGDVVRGGASGSW